MIPLQSLGGAHKLSGLLVLLTASVALLLAEPKPGDGQPPAGEKQDPVMPRIARVIRRNPSLKSYPAIVLADAYQDGRDVAEAEAGLLHLPETCPWTVEQVLDRAFWPGLPWEPMSRERPDRHDRRASIG